MSDSAHTASRSRRSAGTSPGKRSSVQRASAAANRGTRASGSPNSWAPSTSGIEIALTLRQLGIEPALAQTERREHDPLRPKMLDQAIEHDRGRRQRGHSPAGHTGVRPASRGHAPDLPRERPHRIGRHGIAVHHADRCLDSGHVHLGEGPESAADRVEHRLGQNRGSPRRSPSMRRLASAAPPSASTEPAGHREAG